MAITKIQIEKMITKNFRLAVEVLGEQVLEETGHKIPTLRLGRANRRFGHISKVGNTYKEITVSPVIFTRYANNLELLKMNTGFTNIEDKIMNTICHEIAHMYYWDHSYDHKELTCTFQEMVMNRQGVHTDITQPVIAAEGITKLSDLVNDAKKARAILRKANIQKPGTKWEWTEVPNEVKELLKGI